MKFLATMLTVLAMCAHVGAATITLDNATQCTTGAATRIYNAMNNAGLPIGGSGFQFVSGVGIYVTSNGTVVTIAVTNVNALTLGGYSAAYFQTNGFQLVNVQPTALAGMSASILNGWAGFTLADAATFNGWSNLWQPTINLAVTNVILSLGYTPVNAAASSVFSVSNSFTAPQFLTDIQTTGVITQRFSRTSGRHIIQWVPWGGTNIVGWVHYSNVGQTNEGVCILASTFSLGNSNGVPFFDLYTPPVTNLVIVGGGSYAQTGGVGVISITAAGGVDTILNTDGLLLLSTNGQAVTINQHTNYIRFRNGPRSQFFGYRAGESCLDVGTDNIAVGYEALRANTNGSLNIAVGGFALRESLTCNNNVAIGFSALSNANASVHFNIAIGTYTLWKGTSVSANVAIGYSTLWPLMDGYYNQAIGSPCMISLTNGQGNDCLGHRGLDNLVMGDYNGALGFYAAYYVAGGGFFTGGSNNLYLGAMTRASANGVTNEIVIGYGAVGAGPNTVTIGNTATTGTVLRGTVSATNVVVSGQMTVSNALNASSGVVFGVGGAGGTQTSAGLTNNSTNVTLHLTTNSTVNFGRLPYIWTNIVVTGWSTNVVVTMPPAYTGCRFDVATYGSTNGYVDMRLNTTTTANMCGRLNGNGSALRVSDAATTAPVGMLDRFGGAISVWMPNAGTDSTNKVFHSHGWSPFTKVPPSAGGGTYETGGGGIWDSNAVVSTITLIPSAGTFSNYFQVMVTCW